MKPPVEQKKSENYGIVFYTEIGEVDFFKVSKNVEKGFDWASHFHPVKFFMCVSIKNTHGDIEGQPHNKRFATYSTMMMSDNQDWFSLNQRDPKNIPKKNQVLPVGEDEERLLTWFAHSKDYISDAWLEKNSEYVQHLNEKIKQQHLTLLEAIQNKDMKYLRKAKKWMLDFNYDQGAPLRMARTFGDSTIIQYLLKNGAVDGAPKKVAIPSFKM